MHTCEAHPAPGFWLLTADCWLDCDTCRCACLHTSSCVYPCGCASVWPSVYSYGLYSSGLYSYGLSLRLCIRPSVCQTVGRGTHIPLVYATIHHPSHPSHRASSHPPHGPTDGNDASHTSDRQEYQTGLLAAGLGAAILRRLVYGLAPAMYPPQGPTDGHNYVGHNYIVMAYVVMASHPPQGPTDGHNYIGHNYIGMAYIVMASHPPQGPTDGNDASHTSDPRYRSAASEDRP